MKGFATEHGLVRGGRVAVVALGKLGSREMTASSDLDLILIYDFPADAGDSNGPRRLAPGLYYARLAQRLISALTAPTKAGRLYEVDMRLRPSGRKGPLATQFSSFTLYQRDEAETWEHMALTRARVVAGEASLAAEIAETVRLTLTRKRDATNIARDARAMRALIASEKGDEDAWDLKLVAGGLIDIEFIAQYLSVAFGREHPAMPDHRRAGRDPDRGAPALYQCDAVHAPRDLRPVRSGQGRRRRQTPNRRSNRLSRLRGVHRGARRGAHASARGVRGDRDE
jgi:glutamate-ammonia-ligase adenylyltransferase